MENIENSSTEISDTNIPEEIIYVSSPTNSSDEQLLGIDTNPAIVEPLFTPPKYNKSLSDTSISLSNLRKKKKPFDRIATTESLNISDVHKKKKTINIDNQILSQNGLHFFLNK